MAAIPLTESIFTEIIHEAVVVTAASKAESPAKAQELFKSPDLVRTARASRVELTAKDQTITRVGANTTFTFAEGGREIRLEKGGVLFHAPAGVGGGTIKHGTTTAAVLGTTLIGQVLPDGSFKVLDLEGRVRVTLGNRQLVVLQPGQMVIVAADGLTHGDVVAFDLAELASRLLLVVGFSKPLASMPLITAAIEAQHRSGPDGKPPTLVPWHTAGSGLDIRFRTATDLQFFPKLADAEWSPLDFPGAGVVGPPAAGPGGYPLLPPAGLPLTVPPVISPPPVTAVVP